MATFPVLDVLNCSGSVPALMNPLNFVRWGQRFMAMLLGKHRCTYEPGAMAFDETFTRSEEIEKNDVTPKEIQELPYFQQPEPKAWGTLRLNDFEGRFKAMHLRVNVLSGLIFACELAGYMILIFGEINFYSKLDIAHRNYNHAPGLGHNATLLFSDDAVWSEDFTDLHSRAGLSVSVICCFTHKWRCRLYQPYYCSVDFVLFIAHRRQVLLMFCIVPFAIQASALVTETCILPVIVVETVQAHVENFTVELDQCA